MNYRILGRTGLRVSELGMGCSGIGRTMYRRDDRGALATLQESLDAGVNFYDTAPGYSAGESERLIGEAFRDRRDRVILCSKVGVSGTAVGRFAKRYKHLLRPVRFLFAPMRVALPRLYVSQRRVDFSRDFIVASVEKSLTRLQTDYLDVLLLHHPTPEALRRAEFRDTFDELRKAGKIRHWGVSPDTVELAMMCLEIPGVEVVQLDISMLSRQALDGFLDRARERNVGVVARKVLEQGVLTGANGRTKADLWRTDRQRLGAMKERTERLGFLAREGRTLTHAALLFVRGLQEVATAVVGYSSPEHQRKIVSAYDMPLLSADEYARICAL
jgi:aryl-alcohol dehydrogenase-like predicted oxidoreductase